MYRINSPLFLCLASLFLACLPYASANLRTHDAESFQPDHILRVTERNLSVACETRLSVVVNDTSPGPMIRLKPGAVSWIRVYNDMEDKNLTMHWHGLAQRMADFSDGSVQATQWPIPPLHFFDYEVRTELQDAGTYFYHSHVGMQALSTAGPLVVEDCGDPPYAYDEERVVFLSDYFNKTDQQIEDGLVGVPFKWSGETNAVLVNGKGVALGKEVDGDKCALPVIDVDPGKTYRLRFIGGTGLSHVSFGIADHSNLTIIGVDGGQYTQPYSVPFMQIGSGQRFDVLLKAKTTEELASASTSTYTIQFETKDRPTQYRGYAVLRYNSTAAIPAPPTSPPLKLPNSTYTWVEYALQPLNPDDDCPTLEEVTRRIVINSTQLINPASNQTIWRLNDLNWSEDTYHTPLLVDIYLRGDAALPNYDAAIANNGWDPATKAFPAKVGEVLEIVFQNTGSQVNKNGGVDAHPFHGHGEHYCDLGSGNGTYDAEANEKRIKQMGYRPVKRDTTMLYRYTTVTTAGAPAGWRAWRIKVNNPGVWMIHCHTLQHMIMGMQSVWAVGTADEIRRFPVNESQGYLVYGGDVYGNTTSDPICHHQYSENSQCFGTAQWPRL